MKPHSDATSSQIMTTGEVAHHLRVHQDTLYKLIHRGQIPFFKIGSDSRFHRDVIEKWMADRLRTERPTPGPGSPLFSPASSRLVRPSPPQLR